MTDHVYFNISAGSPAAKPITDWVASIEAHKAWVRTFAKQHDLSDAEWVGANGISVCGFAPKRPKDFMTQSEHNTMWTSWLAAHPLWRKVAPRRGSAYAVPRKVGPLAKALSKEWASRPAPMSTEAVTAAVTGLGFSDLLQGCSLYHCGWKIRDDGSILFAVPYFAAISVNWKPAKGLKRGNHERLRDEWHKVPSDA